MRNYLKLVLAVGCVALSGCVSEPGPTVEETPIAVRKVDFSGSWEMDYRMSEQADQKIRWKYTEALAIEKRARESEQPYGRQRPVIGLEQQVPRSLAAGVIAVGQFTEKISKASVLTIRQDDKGIVIEREDDFALSCDFDDGAHMDSRLGKERCYWFGDQLVFEIALPEGVNVRHVFSMDDRDRLINIATTVLYERIPFTLNRVYTSFEPGDGMYECEFKVTTLKTCRMGSSEQ